MIKVYTKYTNRHKSSNIKFTFAQSMPVAAKYIKGVSRK